MAAVEHSPAPGATSIPELAFAVERAAALAHAAVPTLGFTLGISAGRPIRSILLDVQIQIAARARGYSRAEEDRLQELFGAPERWSATLRTLPWTRTTVVAPAFTGQTEVELRVPCSYDLEVAGARYLSGLGDGTVPLEFLFSGSVFFATPDGALQITRIGSDCEAGFQLPVAVWREAMDRHFPGSAWLRLSREHFQALSAYRARRALAGWDETIDALLGQGQADER